MTGWKAVNPEFAQALRDAVLSMPAARHLGFVFGRIAPGDVEIIQPYRAELSQHDGFFQGGVLGALADFAGGSAAGTLLPAGWVNMTVDYTVKILAPAKGKSVVARGRVVHLGHSTTVAAADLYSAAEADPFPQADPGARADLRERPAGTLCATALVTTRNIKLPRP